MLLRAANVNCSPSRQFSSAKGMYLRRILWSLSQLILFDSMGKVSGAEAGEIRKT